MRDSFQYILKGHRVDQLSRRDFKHVWISFRARYDRLSQSIMIVSLIHHVADVPLAFLTFVSVAESLVDDGFFKVYERWLVLARMIARDREAFISWFDIIVHIVVI